MEEKVLILSPLEFVIEDDEGEEVGDLVRDILVDVEYTFVADVLEENGVAKSAERVVLVEGFAEISSVV